ncbi:hypothetical protein P4E94_19575 [Pontiellaceae bacterium B12219]|nr:hypothetical protein [Pontiellaceae bacterium B12219]
MNEICPSCQSQKTVSGRFLDQASLGVTPMFRPDGLKAFSMVGTDVRVPNGNKFNSCLDCGLLWAKVDPDKLKKVITKHGNGKTKISTGITQ